MDAKHPSHVTSAFDSSLQDLPPVPTPQGRSPRSHSRNDEPPAPSRGRDIAYRLLLEMDRLYFGVLTNAIRAGSDGARADDGGAQTSPEMQALQTTFKKVWERVPESDRQELLLYWQTPPRRLPSDTTPPAQHDPLTRPVEVGSLSSTDRLCDLMGHEDARPLARAPGGNRSPWRSARTGDRRGTADSAGSVAHSRSSAGLMAYLRRPAWEAPGRASPREGWSYRPHRSPESCRRVQTPVP
jgi:hypothetical protein